MKRLVAAHKAITDRAFKLVRRKGAPPDIYPAIVMRGAVDVLANFNVPTGALGVSRELLLATGHDLGQLTLEEQVEDMPDFWADDDEDWEGEDYLPDDYFPEDEEPWPWEGEEPPPPEIEPEKPKPGVTPGPVPIRPDHWDLEPYPDDYGRYRLAWGDTLTGLAATYLGSGGRWKEIWDIQESSYRATHTPNKIYVDEWLNMPDEAVETLLEKTDKPIKGKPSKTGLYIGLGAAAVATVAAIYTFTR